MSLLGMYEVHVNFMWCPSCYFNTKKLFSEAFRTTGEPLNLAMSIVQLVHYVNQMYISLSL